MNNIESYKGDVPKIDMHVHYIPQAYKNALIANYGEKGPDAIPHS